MRCSGAGKTLRNFVAAADVADFAVLALGDPSLAGETLAVGGPEKSIILAETTDQRFDAAPLQQRFGVRLQRLEEWATDRVRREAQAAVG